jgi:GNAT superfamily N-acetyltransferase
MDAKIEILANLSRWLRRVSEVLRWRGPFLFLVLAVREILRPFVYGHVYYIFQTDLQRPLPVSYTRETLDTRIYAGNEDLERTRAELLSMGELPASEIAARFRRGDAVAVAYAATEPTGYMWMAFSSGLELAFGTTWMLAPNEAVRYGSFVLPDWRGRGIHSSLHHALSTYAQARGIVRTLGSISALNSQSLSLPKHFRKAKIMTVILVHVRGLGWTYRKAIGAPLESHFSKRTP